jgi:hypothetical protein
MPRAAQAPAARTLQFGYYNGSMRGALLGHLLGNALSRTDLFKVVDSPSDSARSSGFDSLVGVGRHTAAD